MQNIKAALMMVFGGVSAVAVVLTASALELKKPKNIDSMLGFELDGKGRINRLMDFTLTNGANAMLHGYVPAEGDVVEWYVRNVDDCREPEKLCSFELAIRKRP